MPNSKLAGIYKCLDQQILKKGNYSIVPIRFEDRYLIMKWRNQQIYHLRQTKLLTKREQDLYFEVVVNKLFDQKQPDQLLFSFLENDMCIGYGGLVHINWQDKNAEISFIMNTELDEKHFEKLWSVFLGLIEEVAFKELNLHKIYTYAFDLRPHLYQIFTINGFEKEARLKSHAFVKDHFVDVLIHIKLNRYED